MSNAFEPQQNPQSVPGNSISIFSGPAESFSTSTTWKTLRTECLSTLTVQKPPPTNRLSYYIITKNDTSSPYTVHTQNPPFMKCFGFVASAKERNILVGRN